MFVIDDLESYYHWILVLVIFSIEILLIIIKEDMIENKKNMIYLVLLKFIIYYSFAKLNIINNNLTKAIQDQEIIKESIVVKVQARFRTRRAKRRAVQLAAERQSIKEVSDLRKEATYDALPCL